MSADNGRVERDKSTILTLEATGVSASLLPRLEAQSLGTLSTSIPRPHDRRRPPTQALFLTPRIIRPLRFIRRPQQGQLL